MNKYYKPRTKAVLIRHLDRDHAADGGAPTLIYRWTFAALRELHDGIHAKRAEA